MKTLKIGNLEAIAYHLEQGHDNGGITREALAEFLRDVANELKRMSSADDFTRPSQVIKADPGSTVQNVKQTIIK